MAHPFAVADRTEVPMDINPIHAGQVAFARCLLDSTQSQPPSLVRAHGKPRVALVSAIKSAGLTLLASRLQQHPLR
jgi:hypothetical protein